MSNLSGGKLKAAVLDPQTQWTRRKLQVLLGVGMGVVLLMAAGVVWSVMNMLTGGTADEAAAEAGQSAEDRLANKPLPTAPVEAAQPGSNSLSSGQAGTLAIPPPMEVGPAGVATGFPHTPAGALAQLAAIDSAALTSASVPVAQEVIAQWAAPGGPTTESWSGVKAVAALLESAGMSSDGSGSITIGVDPKMGFIKGTVGEDFVIPCVDFIVAATTTTGQPLQVAAADCQRMVWQEDAEGGRWVIGPGAEPAPAPSLWPGTQESFDAGYQWLEVPQQ